LTFNIYYGTPRHIKNLTDIPWAGSVWDCDVRTKWQPEVQMRIPAGILFITGHNVHAINIMQKSTIHVKKDKQLVHFFSGQDLPRKITVLGEN
jgi:hypothetical protein